MTDVPVLQSGDKIHVVSGLTASMQEYVEENYATLGIEIFCWTPDSEQDGFKIVAVYRGKAPVSMPQAVMAAMRPPGVR
jgi:hypothetical protein